jgi:hypothetical protein
MKRLTAIGALLSLFGLVMAQTPGTLDNSFADNGHYSFRKAGSEAWLNFLTYQQFDNGTKGTDLSWGLLLGGNLYKEFVADGIFMALFSDLDDPIEYWGKPSTDLTDIQDAVFFPEGGILAAGSWEYAGSHEAKVAKFSSPGVVDTDFGSYGSVTVDNQPGRDYIHSIVYNNHKSSDPYFALAGSSIDQNGKQGPVFWRLRADGNWDYTFGTNGKYLPLSNSESGWFNDLICFENVLYGIGTSDSRAFVAKLDPGNLHGSNYLYQQTSDENNIYEFFSAAEYDGYLYPTGYHYNMTIDVSSHLIKTLNTTTMTTDGNGRIDAEAFVIAVETKTGGNITGIQYLTPAPLGPGLLKSEGPRPMIMVGSIILSDQNETTFLAGMNSDGTLDNSFGNGGITLIDLDNGNWPVDVIVSDDGGFFVGINEVGTAHVYKFHPYYDLSGIKQTEVPSESLSVFPNPAEAIVKCNLVIDHAQTVDIWVINSIGQTILESKSKLVRAGSHTLTFDAEQWNQGVYFVKVRSQSRIHTSKFIKK